MGNCTAPRGVGYGEQGALRSRLTHSSRQLSETSKRSAGRKVGLIHSDCDCSFNSALANDEALPSGEFSPSAFLITEENQQGRRQYNVQPKALRNQAPFLGNVYQ